MRRVSSLWTLLPWVMPVWMIPTRWRENVERAVFDGMTRDEWFRARVEELEAANRKNNGAR